MRRTNVLKILIYLAAAAVIVWLMPDAGKFLTSFKEGDRWNNPTLIAPFDVPIYKSASELASERRVADREYVPVYSIEGSVLSDVLGAVYEDFGITDSLVSTIVNPLMTLGVSDRQAVGIFLVRDLRALYARGISASIDKTATERSTGMKLVRVEWGGDMQKISADQIPSPAVALETMRTKLAEQLPSSVRHDQLSAIDLSKYIRPNLRYDNTLNVNLREAEMRNIARTKGVVNEGEVIVSNHQLIDRDIYARLASLQRTYESHVMPQDIWVTRLGYFMIVGILLTLSYVFLFFFRHEFSQRVRNIVFFLFIYVLMVSLCVAVQKIEWMSIYAIPFAIVPIYVMSFFDVRMSVFEFVVSLLMCALLVSKPMEFIFVNFVAGVMGIFVLRNYYRRKRIFIATGTIFASYVISYLAIQMVQAGSFAAVSWNTLFWFPMNALLFLGLYQLLYILEKTFGFVSNITLLELCDTNQKLLLELSHKAPGTFQHSLQVANMAEQAAKAVGANPLLARTGALYHDIGKMNAPEFFIENQSGGFNPHDDLTPHESAAIIIGHVTDGMALASKNMIPAIVTEFITTHHGDSLTYYFYSKQREIDGDTVDENAFRYPGPRPHSKEATICMMCDGVEAASRTLKNYSIETIQALVDKIINVQMQGGQYDNSLLSLSEIQRIKEELILKLKNIYHPRIAYPERK